MAKLEAEVKIISRENIKPSSPTPLHLKTFNLSYFDQVYPSYLHAIFLMFYQFHSQDQDQDHRVRDLKSSLSETLNRFYPLAGRIIENEPLSIDCTDEGADFIEAKVSCRMSDILKRPDPAFLAKLYPTKTHVFARDGHVLLVQTNLFDCGGIAIGVSISHRVSDAATLFLFIKEWAAQARGGVRNVVTPDLNVIASQFPVVRFPISMHSTTNGFSTTRLITRRFVFDSKSINALRAKATSASVQQPSRVQVVAGHICLSMMRLKSGAKSYVLIQAMNLRKKILDPPISENCFGNLLGLFFSQAQENHELMTLDHLVSEFGKGLRNQTEKLKNMNDGQEIITLIRTTRAEVNDLTAKEDVKKIRVSSMCKSGYYDNSDYGWGKPVWVGHGEGGFKNFVLLMDTKDGDGIEAWVTLKEHEVDLLETDQDFLEFASLNPSVDLL